ncbi:Methyltransferase type 11 domain protein, partial [Candidatus Magnetomorum sp. HK-1]
EFPVVNANNCYIPFKDNSFDIGFSLGVFMNIHPLMAKLAFSEMMRVCKKYIIHIEYDENNTFCRMI